MTLARFAHRVHLEACRRHPSTVKTAWLLAPLAAMLEPTELPESSSCKSLTKMSTPTFVLTGQEHSVAKTWEAIQLLLYDLLGYSSFPVIKQKTLHYLRPKDTLDSAGSETGRHLFNELSSNLATEIRNRMNKTWKLDFWEEFDEVKSLDAQRVLNKLKVQYQEQPQSDAEKIVEEAEEMSAPDVQMTPQRVAQIYQGKLGFHFDRMMRNIEERRFGKIRKDHQVFQAGIKCFQKMKPVTLRERLKRWRSP